MLTDHFTSPPIEVWVTRTDQWLFCTDYGVTVNIKALDPVTVNKVEIKVKFFEEGTYVPTVTSRSYSGFSLAKGESKQIATTFNYCPQRRVDPLILLEIYVYMGGPLIYVPDTNCAVCQLHYTQFDLARGGKQVTGHATEYLPQVELEYDEKTGDIYAVSINQLVYGKYDNLA